MNQSTLHFPPASRRTDPVSSHEAEAWMNDSGKRLSDMEIAVKLVHDHPGHTKSELSTFGPLTSDQLGKRLADACRKGWIVTGNFVRCSQTRRRAMTWWPADTHAKAAA